MNTYHITCVVADPNDSTQELKLTIELMACGVDDVDDKLGKLLGMSYRRTSIRLVLGY